MYDKSIKEKGKYLSIDGSWNFDETAKLYTVTLNGEVSSFTIVEPESTGVCMLVTGDLGAADLRSSWFSSLADDDPGDDREPDTGL